MGLRRFRGRHGVFRERMNRALVFKPAAPADMVHEDRLQDGGPQASAPQVHGFFGRQIRPAHLHQQMQCRKL